VTLRGTLRSPRLVASYISLAIASIVGSDYAWAQIARSPVDATIAQIVTGGLFIVATASFLYWRLRRDETHINRQQATLVRAYDATLEGWSRALDIRDHDTEGHSARVAALTVPIAREMGVPEGELVHVRRGALLHDIGKIGIRDRVLLRTALDIRHCHHDRWDGSGYPRGLQGAHIPLPERIFAVVDIWDVLRSHRPYRRAWSDDEARSYIESLAGTHLDPQVVRVFLDVIDGKTGRM